MRVLNSFHDLCQPLRRLGFAVGGSEQHFHSVLVAVLHDQPPRGLGHEEDVAVLISEPLDEGLGHSFCYIRPAEEEQENAHHNLGSLKLDIPREFNGDSQEQRSLINCESTIFKSISGASVSANTSTPLTTTPTKQNDSFSYYDRAAAFESSTSFSAIPLMI